MARQEVGKVQEMLMVSSQAQQEAAVESESSEDKAQQHTVVGWNLFVTMAVEDYKHQQSNTISGTTCREDHITKTGIGYLLKHIWSSRGFTSGI